jgi:hypothetical protein
MTLYRHNVKDGDTLGPVKCNVQIVGTNLFDFKTSISEFGEEKQ